MIGSKASGLVLAAAGAWLLSSLPVAGAAVDGKPPSGGESVLLADHELSVVEPKILRREPRFESWLGIGGGLQRFGVSLRDELRKPVGGLRKAFLTDRDREILRRQRFEPSHIQYELGYSLDRVLADFRSRSADDFIHEFRLGVDYRHPQRVEFAFNAHLGTIPEEEARFGGIQVALGYTHVFQPTLAQVLQEDFKDFVDDDEEEAQSSKRKRKKSEILDEELASDEIAEGKILRPAVWGRFSVDASGVLQNPLGADLALRRKALRFELGYRSGGPWELGVLASFSDLTASATPVLSALRLTNRSANVAAAVASNGFAPYQWLSGQLQDLDLTVWGRLDLSSRLRLNGVLTFRTYEAGGLGPTVSIHPAASYELNRSWRVGADLDLVLGEFGAAPIFGVSGRYAL